MKYTILMGSSRKQGNTAALAVPFREELERLGGTGDFFWLHDMEIQPCVACRACQNDWEVFGCVQRDDVQQIFDALRGSDLIIFATPIYSWFCTPPMKALLDRMVYGMNKYYGNEKGPSLWKGAYVAALVTCGYPPEKGADLFGAGMERYCKHSGLHWLGMHAERHMGYDTKFMDEDKERRAYEFANKLFKLAVPIAK